MPGTRHRQLHFDRLSAGIVDFCSIETKLIIELDGSQHLEQTEYDEEPTQYLGSQEYKILRFWNNQVEKEMNRIVRVTEMALIDK